MAKTQKILKRQRRHRKVRSKVFGTADIPRACVFRSNRHIYVQLINDDKGITLAATDSLSLNGTDNKKTALTTESRGEKAKTAAAFNVGKEIAAKAAAKKIKKVVFDRGGYKYHGRVKALAEGIQEGGLKF